MKTHTPPHSKVDIITRSKEEAGRILPQQKREWSVVSIGSPGSDPPAGFNPKDPEHKRFEFDDIRNDPTPGQEKFYRAPSKEDVAQIIEHGQKADRPILSHCRAGVSRGTAAAWAIRCAHGEPPRQALHRVVKDRPQASPNPLMTQHADDILEQDGEMVQALDELPPPRQRDQL
ncbi:MAG: hypothetical protein ABEN55_02575 [Bradymonadaceae bacterium]